jgi:sugar lactone lactonase YvrE
LGEVEVRELTLPGLKFPEGPRWRDGTWWVSDQLGGSVHRIDDDGRAVCVVELDAPSGLGFLPDGALLAACMNEPRLVRVGDAGVEELVDLRAVAGHLNDMVVTPEGRVYVDAYDDHFDQSSHRVVMVGPERDVTVVATDVAYPNGITTTRDGTTLLLAETFGARITAFDVEPDGTLTGRRTWAELPGAHPDGACLDADGDVWVASYLAGEFLHVREGGEVLDRVAFGARWAMSCCLGGDDGRSLLLCTAETTQDDYFAGRSVGHLDVVRVDVPGVGCP